MNSINDGNVKSSRLSIELLKSSVLFSRLGTPANGLMAAEIQNLSWPRSPQLKSLKQYVRLVGIGLPVLIALLIAVIDQDGQRQGLIATALLIPTILLGIGADLYYLANGLNSVSVQRLAGNAEPNFIIAASDQDLVAARNGIARIRSWRLLAVEIGLRLLLATMFVMDVMILRRSTASISYLMVLGLTVLVLITAVLEPLWRMRATTAIGVAAIRKQGSKANATLTAVGVIVGLRVIQFLILFGVVWIVSKLIESSFPIYTASGYSELGYLPIALSLAFGVVFGSLLMWIYFRVWRMQAERISLQVLTRHT